MSLPSDCEDDEVFRRRDPDRARARWISEHFETLQELHWLFLESGRQAFGEAFFQLGDFTRFVHFVYDNTQLGRVTWD